MFVPRKFHAMLVITIGGDLWGYLAGGGEQVDYYLRPDGTPSEAAAELHGRLWARLGLEAFDRAAFQRLATGCHPRTGERLVKTSHITKRDPATGTQVPHGGMRVPGIDCNLSPPKSVSALLPFASPAERAALERAHQAAVRVTLKELETRVAACRPTINGEQVHTPGELGIAVFTHHTSRPTRETAAEPGRPPDPQLHSHAFIFNLAWCQGRYLAVDSRPVYQFATTAEAIYACQLAAELQCLGYQLAWHQTGKGRTWDLAGVDRRLLDLFSSRHRHLHQQVAAFQAQRHRPPTLRERGRLAARDRAPKPDACRAPHWPAYRAVLARHGQPVVLVSTAAETARRTARELDLDHGYTVEAFARAVQHGRLQPAAGWVVLVEEAAMMDTPRMATLLDAAGPAAIRTLGDPEQAQPVGAGGWQGLVDRAIGGHAELTRVVRQRHLADREVCQAIRDGHAPQALASLQARDRLHLAPTRSTAIKEVVHSWERHRRIHGLEGVAIVTDTDNATVDTFNALCQARRQANGELTGPAVTVVDRTHSRCEHLFPGDRVRFVRPYIATNDMLRTHMPNGTAGHVLAVDPDAGEVVVKTDDGRVVTVRPAVHEDGQPLRLGYAGHALKLQGGQAPVVLVLPAAGRPASSRPTRWRPLRRGAARLRRRGHPADRPPSRARPCPDPRRAVDPGCPQARRHQPARADRGARRPGSGLERRRRPDGGGTTGASRAGGSDPRPPRPQS
jgi:conjugative relaxase-like TrwC/TraI family protein